MLTELALADASQGKIQCQLQAWKITFHCPATHSQASKI